MPELRPLAEVEEDHIASVMHALGHNMTRAALALRIDRRTLYRRLAGSQRLRDLVDSTRTSVAAE